MKICNVNFWRQYNLTIFFIILLFIFSCSETRLAGRYEPLIGTWRTEQGIIIDIQVNEETTLGAEASIKNAPGFLGGEISKEKIVMNGIKPIPDGGWSGFFIMPNNEKPVKVDISVFKSRKMLIISRDKRVKKKRMVWERVRSISDNP